MAITRLAAGVHTGKSAISLSLRFANPTQGSLAIRLRRLRVWRRQEFGHDVVRQELYKFRCHEFPFR